MRRHWDFPNLVEMVQGKEYAVDKDCNLDRSQTAWESNNYRMDKARGMVEAMATRMELVTVTVDERRNYENVLGQQHDILDA
jgi:hypothetical protein